MHLPLHVGLTIGDYIAHDKIVESAMVRRSDSFLRWLSAKVGLAVDAASHALAAALLASGSISTWYVWPAWSIAFASAAILYFRANWRYIPPCCGGAAAQTGASDAAPRAKESKEALVAVER